MIAGWFDTRERPTVRARLIIPRLDVDGRIDFLIDTGATFTSLHPDDGKRIGCPFDELRSPRNMAGVGGSNQYFREPAIIVLYGRSGPRALDIELLVSKPQPASESDPRPVVNRFRLILGDDVLVWRTAIT